MVSELVGLGAAVGVEETCGGVGVRLGELLLITEAYDRWIPSPFSSLLVEVEARAAGMGAPTLVGRLL